MPEITEIIFDLGNVLVEIYPERAMERFAKQCSLPLSAIRTVFLSPLHLDFMAGKISPEEFYQKVTQQYSCPIPREEFVRSWELVIGPPKDGIEALIEKLASRYTLSICSNTDPWHWDYVIRRYGFVRHFQHIFLSYQLGYNKPHLRVFEQVLQQLQRPSNQVVFIDDSEENIQAAKKMGIQGIVANSASQIEEKLSQLIQW